MTDTNAELAKTAEKITAGRASPYLRAAAARCAPASEIRARRIFFPALAAFKSNCLDAADLSPACRDELLALIRVVEANAPSQTSWDNALVQRAGRQ